MAARRGYGTGAVSYEDKAGTVCRDARGHRGCEGRWRGVASVQVGGQRKWFKVSGPTKQIAAERLREKLDELGGGVVTRAAYTVERCVQDWLEHGLNGRSQQTRDNYRDTIKALLELIGTKPLAKLTVPDVRRGLAAAAEGRSDRTVRLMHDILTRAIDMAVADNRAARNVSALLTNRPEG